VRFVWENSPRLLLGASDLIRVADRVARPKEIEVYSNRGLSGIDGTVSTAIGIAQEKQDVTALIGDLTLLHDANGLNRSDLGEMNVRLVVGNDNGGHIFSRLEVNELLPKESIREALRYSAGGGSSCPWQQPMAGSISAARASRSLKAAWEENGFVLIDYGL
jgi:2-succinyl-5-enolpyruvyl-6-hydroxy-3-cyclohexene-1-carboxylate synthase